MLLNFETVAVAGGLFFFWLVGLTIWFLRLARKQKRLAWGKEEADLEKILDVVREKIEGLGEEQGKIRGDLGEQLVKAKRFLKEPGVVRYNPFPETGGDHSFSMTLVDQNGDGVIITGLHAREGTRVYAKPIKQGKAEYKLSREEEKSLKEALK